MESVPARPPGQVASRPGVGVVVVATAGALRVERGGPAGPVRWSAASTADIVEAARVHRVGGLIVDRAEALGVPEAVRTPLRAIAVRQVIADLHRARATVAAVDVLRRAGVGVLAFKGAALAVQSAGDVTARGSVDVDLLVRPQDLPATHAALTSAGYRGEPLPPAGRWRQWYLAVRRERSYVGSDGVEIDLHWRLGWHSRPIPPTSTLLARSVDVGIGDVAVPTLSVPDAFAAACYHAAVDRYARLRLLVDIARLVGHPDVRMPGDATWRLRRVVGESVALTELLLGPLPGANGFVPAHGVDLATLADRWAMASVRPQWLVDDLSLAQVVGVYADSARFGGAGAALAMGLTDALLPPERIDHTGGFASVAAGVGHEVADLVRRRVLRRPA